MGWGAEWRRIATRSCLDSDRRSSHSRSTLGGCGACSRLMNGHGCRNLDRIGMCKGCSGSEGGGQPHANLAREHRDLGVLMREAQIGELDAVESVAFP